jgi:hypothetical protein
MSRDARRLSLLCAALFALSALAVVPASASALPNLVVTSVAPLTATTGHDVRFSAVVTNTGTTATTAGEIIGVRFSVDGTGVSWSDDSTASLAAGASRTLTANGGPDLNAVWTATAGAHTLDAWVDDVARITESSDADNRRQATLNVTTTPANLVVSSIGTVTAKAGDAGTFSATIRNTGGTATPVVTHGVRFSVDGVAVSWSDNSTASLAPGATRTLTANGGPDGNATWTATAGAHTLNAFVDDVNRIPEGVETDNRLDMPFSVGSAPTKPRVFAHWHHSAQRAVSGYNDVDDYQLEIRRAKAMGVEGFAYNVIDVDLELPELEDLYTAANLEGNFWLFPSADLNPSIAIGMSDAKLDRLAYWKYTDPARLRTDGGRFGDNIPVMQTWHGQAKGASYWTTRQNAWKSEGKPMYFIPYFPPSGSPVDDSTVDATFNTYDGSVSGQSDDIVDGFFNFSGWANLTDAGAAVPRNRAYDTAADARAGMDAMYGCAPHFNRHDGTSDVQNRIIGDFEGFNAWILCLEALVLDNPRFIEFPTWNDYLEGSYLGGPYPRTALWATFRGNEYSHDAFREIGAYYMQWFKSGVKPVPSTDLIAIAHRQHPRCAPGPHPGSDGSATCSAAANDTDNAETRSGTTTTIRPLKRQLGATSTDDNLYGAVILKSPGTVIMTTGSTSKSFALPAGVSRISMPFTTGTQSIKLVRDNVTVTSKTSDVQIIAKPNVFNYNVNTAWARK